MTDRVAELIQMFKTTDFTIIKTDNKWWLLVQPTKIIRHSILPHFNEDEQLF